MVDVREFLMKVRGVILAGGQSRRMGRNKALLPLRGEPLLAHVIRALQQVTDDLLLVTNTPATYALFRLPMVEDLQPGYGALGGIYTALRQLSEHERALIVACDMPFLLPPVLRHLIQASEGFDIAVPLREGNYETLCAVYTPCCIAPIERLMAQGIRRIDRLYPLVRVRRVEPTEWQAIDPDGWTFFNINSPEDYERAQRLEIPPLSGGTISG